MDPSTFRRVTAQPGGSLEAPRFDVLKRMACYLEVHERMAKGWPATKVADFIQLEHDELVQIDRDKVVKLLNDYRQVIPPAELVSHAAPTAHQNAVAVLNQGMDVMRELEWLFGSMKERIIQGRQEETDVTGMLDHKMTPEYQEARSTLMAYHQVQKDMGLVSSERRPESNATQINMMFAGQSPAAVSVANSAKRSANVMSAFESMLALVTKREEEAAAAEAARLASIHDADTIDVEADDDAS